VSKKPASPSCKSLALLPLAPFLRIPASAELNSRRNSPAPTQHALTPQASDSGEESKRRSGKHKGKAKQGEELRRANARAQEHRELLTSERMRIGEWMAGERRKASRARNLGRGYLHGLHLLGAAVLYYVAVACELCVQYRLDSRAEVTAHRACPASAQDDRHVQIARRIAPSHLAKVMLARGDVAGVRKTAGPAVRRRVADLRPGS